MGSHAEQEAMRVLALALEHARRGEIALRGGERFSPDQPTPPPPQTVTPQPEP